MSPPSEHSGKTVKSGGSKRNIDSLYSEIQSEAPPDKVNMGPFDIYAVIDGHRGPVIAEFIKDHLMDVILRNENMLNKYKFRLDGLVNSIQGKKSSLRP